MDVYIFIILMLLFLLNAGLSAVLAMRFKKLYDFLIDGLKEDVFIEKAVRGSGVKNRSERMYGRVRRLREGDR